MARARYGEGELVETKPGVWRVAVERLPDPYRRAEDGKPKRRRYVRIVRGKRADALKVKRELEALKAEEQPGSDSTLRQIANEWYRRNLHRWDGQTPANYANAMRHLEPLMERPVASITRKEVADLHAWWRDKGMGEATIHKAHRVLVTILNQAIQWDALTVNPATRAVTLSQPKGRADTPPDEAAVSKMVDAAEGDTLAVIALMATTGARLQEVLAIRWSEVDMTTGVITIDGAMKGRTRATLERGLIKNKKPRRVLLDPDTLAALAERRDERAELAGAPVGYLFSMDHRGEVPWLPSSMGQRTLRLRNELGIEREAFWNHGLRHRAATKMLKAGVPLTIVAQTLGQEETTTLRFYNHVVDDVPDAAARVLGGILSGRNSPLHPKAH